MVMTKRKTMVKGHFLSFSQIKKEYCINTENIKEIMTWVKTIPHLVQETYGFHDAFILYRNKGI